MSIPTFISDVGHEVGHFVNEQTEAFTASGSSAFPLVAPEGGREPLLALMEGLDMGSDHDVFREGSWAIPGLYLHDWPDRYIHTNFDTAAMIDPTKLKRSAFIGAVNAWFLANMSDADVPAVLALLKRNALQRSGALLEQLQDLEPADAAAVSRVHFTVERRKVHSVESFAMLAEHDHEAAMAFLGNLETMINTPDAAAVETDNTVYRRNAAVTGPMSGFGYSYVRDHYGDEQYGALQLPRFSSAEGSSGEYVYEALNLVDGKRSVSEIRNWLTAELGPVPVEYVREYLAALNSIDVIQLVD